MTHKFLRPKKVDVGRGMEPARIKFIRGGSRRELPAGGARVTTEGPEGLFWARRLREGSVEEYDPAPATKPAKSKTRKSEETT